MGTGSGRRPSALVDSLSSMAAKEWHPEDHGYWLAKCGLCGRQSPMLQNQPRDWLRAHAEAEHPDDVSEALRMCGTHYVLHSEAHSPDCGIFRGDHCTCGLITPS